MQPPEAEGSVHFADAVVSGNQEYSPWPHAAGVRFARCAELPCREFRHCSHHHPGGGFEAASQITVPQAVV